MKSARGLAVAVVLAAGAHLPAVAAVGPQGQHGVKDANTAPWPDAATLEERRRHAEALKLFASADLLPMTLAADFKAVNRDRNTDSTQMFPGALTFAKDDGAALTVPIELRTRGHLRRHFDMCSFAPLRLELPKDQVKGTVFDSQHTVKLGVHCKDIDEYEQYVLREYAIYKLFNVLSPKSFRARLAKVTYVNQSNQKPITKPRYGLLLEDEDDAAARMTGRITDQEHLAFAHLDSPTLDVMMLFEYLIGNTDLSISGQHNVKLTQNQIGTIFPVPYDFDFAGVVNAPYAVPEPILKIGTVRERLYRGACRTQADWEPVVAAFQSKRTQLEAVYDTIPGLNEGYKKDAVKYLEAFFKTFEKPDGIKKALIDKCVKAGVM